MVGITRLRNESLILRDSLDYLGKHVDAIVAYDDSSTDRRWKFFAAIRKSP